MENPKKIIWTNEFSSGDIEIDNEHSQLIEIYNKLVECIELKGKGKEFADILSKMKHFCFAHFEREEEYMEKLYYPKLIEHKSFHIGFLVKVTKYYADLFSNNPPDLKDITMFIGKWWYNHIVKSDIAYEQYKNKIQSDIDY